MDNELIDNLNLRSKLNRNWRQAVKDNLHPDIQKEYRLKYLQQKRLTISMADDKKVHGRKKR